MKKGREEIIGEVSAAISRMKRWLHYICGSDVRSVNIFKNVLASFFIKGWSLVVQFLVVPLTLDCLSGYEFGVWLTINSLFVWIDNCDIGLGNGLRNKLTESLAKGDMLLARRQVSTTFVMLIIISFFLLLVSNTIICQGNIYSILNVNRELLPNLPLICSLLFSTMCITFIAKGLNSFLLALQKPALSNLVQVTGSTLSLIGIACLSSSGSRSFLWVTFMYTALPLFSYLCFGLYFFGKKYKYLRPSVLYFDSHQVGPLMSLGVKFFIGQISVILLMFTSNIIISNAISPEAVTPYQVASRYFSLILVPMTLVFTPIWSATTDAYVRNDVEWIKNIIVKFRYGVMLIGAVVAGMFLTSGFCMKLWVGDKVSVDSALMSAVASFTFFEICGLLFSNIIYGIGKISLTVFTYFVTAVFFCILAMPVTKTYGVVGLVTLQTLIIVVNALQKIVQCRLILTRRARGIFNR